MAHKMLVKTKTNTEFIKDEPILEQIKAKMDTQNAFRAQFVRVEDKNGKLNSVPAPSPRATVFSDAAQRSSVIAQTIDTTDLKPDEIALAKASRERFIDEWCALVSMLALNYECEYGVKFDNNTLSDDREERFILTLVKEAKKDHTDIQQKYDILYKYRELDDREQDMLLGSTHKEMLVCPSPNMSDVIATSDVLELLENNEQYRRRVAVWLRELKLRGVGLLDNQTDRLINEFTKRIGKLYDKEDYHLSESGTGVFMSAGFFQDGETPDQLNSLLDKRVIDIHDPPEKDTWRAFFAALALNDIRSYGMTFKRDGRIVIGDSTIANKDVYSHYSPQKGIFKFNSEDFSLSYNGADKPLDAFELTCLYAWLERFLNKYPQTNDVEKEINSYALNLKGKIEERFKTYDAYTCESILKRVKAAEDRFNGVDIEDPFQSSINKKVTSFFCDDKEGSLGKTIRQQWCNVLFLLALRDMRGFDLEFTENKIRYKDKDEYVTIAQMGGSMQIEPCDSASSVVSRAIDSLLIHEKLLVAFWFSEFGKRVETCSFNDSDKALLLELINEYSNKLMNKGDSYDYGKNVEACEFLTKDGLLYSIKEYEGFLSPLVNYYIKDNLFEPKIVVFNSDFYDVVKSGPEKTDATSIYSITSVNQNISEAKYILLPFCDGMITWMKKEMDSRTKEKRLNEPADFPINGVRTVSCSDGYIFEFKFNSELLSFSMQKSYESNRVKKYGDAFNGLGGAAIWPDIEIEGFRAYKLNYIQLFNSKNMDIDIPDFANKVIEKQVTDSPVVFRLGQNESKFNSFAFKLSEFPRFVKFSCSEASGWMLFTPSARVCNPKDSIFSYRTEEGIIGIDLGTSNSLVWIRTKKQGGDTEIMNPLQLDESDGKILLAPREEQYCWIFFQTPFASGEKKGDIFPTMCTVPNPIDRTGIAQPLINGNICIVARNDKKRDNDFFSMADRYLYHNLKWDDMRSQELEIFFGQLALSAFVYLVKEQGEKPRKISIRVSNPGAFTANQIQNYEKAWEKVYEMLNEDIDHINVGDGNKLFSEIEFFTESYCASKASSDCYSGGRNYIDGLAVIDIGGGTTDVTWAQSYEKEENIAATDLVKAELSIKFAARSIFSSLYLKKGRIDFTGLCNILEDGFKDQIDSANKEFYDLESTIKALKSLDTSLSDKNLRQAEFYFERLLTVFDTLVDKLDKIEKEKGRKIPFSGLGMYIDPIRMSTEAKKGTDDKRTEKVQECRHHNKIRFMCAALFFTVGAMLSRIKIAKGFDFSIGKILLAGKGSRVLEFFSDLRDEKEIKETPEEYLLKFYRAGQQHYRDIIDINTYGLKIESSNKKRRKHEVASGLVGTDSKGSRSPQSAPVIAELRVIPSIAQDDIDLEAQGFTPQMYQMTKKVGHFLRVFKKCSRVDFSVLFNDRTDILNLGDITSDLLEQIDYEIKGVIDTRDSNSRTLFPLDDAFEYAVLEFAAQVIMNFNEG